MEYIKVIRSVTRVFFRGTKAIAHDTVPPCVGSIKKNTLPKKPFISDKHHRTYILLINRGITQ